MRLPELSVVFTRVVIAAGLACVGFSVSAASGAPWDWVEESPSPTPSSRFAHSMSFDSIRNTIVLFGGQANVQGGGGAVNAETWELSGSVWSQKVVAGPSARGSQRSVFDSARGKTVLFGGANSTTLETFADTWEWDGTSWLQRAVTGPSARGAQAMAFDSKRNVTVMFGGSTVDGVMSGDTWEWDGNAWALRSQAGPSARALSAMAFDEDRGVCVLFGGLAGTSALGDTWEWDGTAWMQRAISGPEPRVMSAMVYDERLHAVLLVGGRGVGNDFSDTWAWDGSAWTEIATTGGINTAYHGLARDRSRNVTVRFGNEGREYVPHTWMLEGAVCVGDLNKDGVVDDADFSLFAVAYDILDCNEPAMPAGCPADLNGDGLVDDADFSEFVVAYDALVCE